METMDKIIKGCKVVIMASIALMFVSCAVGTAGCSPDVNINGLDDGDVIHIFVEESDSGKAKHVKITKNGKDIIKVIEGEHGPDEVEIMGIDVTPDIP